MRLGSIYFAWKAIWKRRGTTIFISLIWACGLLGLATIERFEMGITNALQFQLKNTDLLITAKGSPTQAILANVFHLKESSGNISNLETEELLGEYNLQNIRRIAYGDNYMGHRILGCDSATWNNILFYSLKGSLPKKPQDALIGYKAAASTNLKIGDKFYGSHGLIDHSISNENGAYIVSGIFKSRGSSWNKLILSDINSVWAVHQGSDSSYTAVLAKIENPLEKLLIPRKIQSNSSMMAVSPAFEVNNILNWINQGARAFNSVSILLLLIASFSMLFLLQSHIRERIGDYALIIALGGTWWHVAKIVLWQNLILGLFAIGLTYLGLMMLWLTQDLFLPLSEIFQQESFWNVYQDRIWILSCLILSTFTSLGPWIWLQKIPLHNALVDS